jgi:iron complex outermembrane receptor protein
MRHSFNSAIVRSDWAFGRTSSALAIAIGVCSAAPAWAQSASDDAPAIADIVVTAQKRAENVQDVPKSVSVVNQAELLQAGVSNIQDLSRVAVSIQGLAASPFAPPAIRGISSFALSIGVQTQTGVVLDDIPQPSFSTLANELTDIERVEVLPGPQSTLSGRNAAGGLINIVTHNPTKTFTGTFNAEQTNDRQTKIGGYVSGPLSNTVGFSLSGFYNQWKGNTRNLGENGKLLGGFNQRGIRAKLQWQPVENLTFLLTGFYTKGTFETTPLIGGSPYILATPTAGSVFASPGSTFATLYPGVKVGPGNREIYSTRHGEAANENKGASLRVDYDFSLGTLSSISGYSKNTQPRSDAFTAFPLFGFDIVANTNTVVDYYSQEVRLASPQSNHTLDYLAGAIYTDTRNYEPYQRAILFPVNWDRTAYVRSFALYGRATWHFAENTSVTGGLRYQHDRQSYRWIFNDGVTPTSANSTGYDFVAGEASLQHDFAPNVKSYVTYSNAETGRAYDLENNNGAASSAGLQPIPSEKVQNIEAGFKTQWLDRRLTINISAFHANYQNYQVQSLQTGSANSVPVIRIFAVGRVRTQGVELSTSFVPVNALHLGFDATYLDAKITDYPGAQCYVGQSVADGCVNGVQNRRGSLPGTSKFRAVATVDYTISLPSAPFDATLGAYLRYQGPSAYDVFGSPLARQDGFATVNLTAGLKSHDSGWSAELFVNNLTNKHYYSSVTTDQFQPVGATAVSVTYARDSFRYFGGRVRFHF